MNFKARIGDVILAANTREDFDWLMDKVARLRMLSQPIKPSVREPSTERVLSVDGRIRRTIDEIARGLTIEQALEERKANHGVAPISEDNRGVAFTGNLDVTELDPTEF